MKYIDATREPRILRDIDVRNAVCRGKWAEKFHSLSAPEGYADQRIGGKVRDAIYAAQRRIARHRLNKIMAVKARKDREDEIRKQIQSSKNVSILHKLQAS